jgi:hypothetical protein
MSGVTKWVAATVQRLALAQLWQETESSASGFL